MKKPELKFTKPNLPKLKRPGGTSKSSVKPPKFAADLYADLRDRRLLPLVALLVVAIAAAPILLSGGGEDETPAPASPPPATASASQASFTVVPAEQELRDYRKRLDHRAPRDPFRQPVAKAEGSDASGGEAESGGEVSVTETTETSGSETGAVEYSPAHPVVKVKATIGYAAVLKTEFISRDPKEQVVEPETKLPNEKNPAIVFTGISPDKKGALFLMTGNVTAYYGKGQCVLGGEICQEIKLRVGKSATFAIGYGETRYKVTLRGFAPIVREAKVEPGD